MMQQNNLRDEIHFKSYQVVVIFIVCHTLPLQRYKYIMKNGKWKKRHRKKRISSPFYHVITCSINNVKTLRARTRAIACAHESHIE